MCLKPSCSKSGRTSFTQPGERQSLLFLTVSRWWWSQICGTSSTTYAAIIINVVPLFPQVTGLGQSTWYWFKKAANQKGPYQKRLQTLKALQRQCFVNDMYGSYISSWSLLFPVSEVAADMHWNLMKYYKHVLLYLKRLNCVYELMKNVIYRFLILFLKITYLYLDNFQWSTCT